MQQALAQAGIPQLANVFYYGKDFGTKKQKLTKEGEIIEEDYTPLSVVQAGVEPEQVAEAAKAGKNDAFDTVGKLMSENTSFDDLLRILRG